VAVAVTVTPPPVELGEAIAIDDISGVEEDDTVPIPP
jgi:hypothetical protein